MTTGNDLYTQEELETLQRYLECAGGVYTGGYLAAGLDRLMTVQHTLTSPLRKKPTAKEYLATCSLALMIEVGELLNELPWKPWKKDHKTDVHKILDEVADVLAFLGNVLDTICILYPEITATDIAMAYVAKSKVNKERFLGNVDQYGIG